MLLVYVSDDYRDIFNAPFNFTSPSDSQMCRKCTKTHYEAYNLVLVRWPTRAAPMVRSSEGNNAEVRLQLNPKNISLLGNLSARLQTSICISKTTFTHQIYTSRQLSEGEISHSKER